jgi:hypothetical protein
MGILGSLASKAADELFGREDTASKEISISVYNITNKKWDLTDDFGVTFNNNYISGKLPDKLKSTFTNESTWKYAITGVALPPLSSQEMDVVLGGTRRNNVRMHESFRFSITFRDFENGSLRKIMTAIFVAQQYEYFDNIKSSIEIFKGEGEGKTVMFQSDNCLILSIGAQSFGHDQSAFSEFTVNFISPAFNDELIKDLGIDWDYNEAFKK